MALQDLLKGGNLVPKEGSVRPGSRGRGNQVEFPKVQF